MITYYKSITFLGNPEKQSKLSLYSVKIFGIVGVLSFSERLLLAGLDRTFLSPQEKKNINYITFCIFWSDVLICLFRFGSSLAFSLLPWKLINMTPPCGIKYATLFFFLLSHWQRDIISALFSSCAQIIWSRPWTLAFQQYPSYSSYPLHYYSTFSFFFPVLPTYASIGGWRDADWSRGQCLLG